MGIFDLAIIGVILVSAAIGLFRGFIKELLSLVAWLVSFWLAFTFSQKVSVLLDPYVAQPELKIIAAFAGIFIISLLILSLINLLLHKLFAATGLTGTDRSLGVLFGLARGVVIIAVFVLFTSGSPLAKKAWWKESILVGYFYPVANVIHEALP